MENRCVERLIILLSILALLFIFYSCRKTNSRNQDIIEEWIEKEIIIPQELKFKCLGRDTTNLDILNHRYKILVYIDSTGCTPCHLMIPEWKAYMDKCNHLSYDVGFLFVIQSNNYRALEQELYLHHFAYPIIYDLKNEFNKLNKFPREDKYRTFLLDESNRVIIVGSPLNNDKIRALYETVLGGSKIRKLESTDSIANNKSTAVELNRDSVNLGVFSFQSQKRIPFILKNLGEQPLTILNVNTSCGCTVAKYDKKPIAQGESTTVVLEYKPNSLGYFKKTANIVCNVPEGFVRLTISGEVIK